MGYPKAKRWRITADREFWGIKTNKMSAGDDAANFGGGGGEQWSFDDSLDGLEESLDLQNCEDQPMQQQQQPVAATGSTAMHDVPAGDDGWNDDDLGLVSFEDGTVALDAKEPPPATDTVDESAGRLPSPRTTHHLQLPPPRPPADESSPSQGKAAAARVLGTGLHLLGAGLSATVAALAEPDDGTCSDGDDKDDDCGWDDDDGLSFGSDNERNGGLGQPVAATASPAETVEASSSTSARDEQYQPPPPPPFPTAASLLPTASRWGAVIAGVVAPVGNPQNNIGGGDAPAPPTAATTIQVPPGNQSVDGPSNHSIKVGPGPFLGRITKLIEDAAAPDHAEDRTFQQQQQPPPLSPQSPHPSPPPAAHVSSSAMGVDQGQGQPYPVQNSIDIGQNHDAIDSTPNTSSGGDGWGDSYDEFDFDESKDEPGDNDVGHRVSVEDAEFDPSRASVHEAAYGQTAEVLVERQEEDMQQTLETIEGGGTASREVTDVGMSLSEGVVTPIESEFVGVPETSAAPVKEDGSCTAVCGTACLAAASGEVCKCIEQMVTGSNNDDDRISQLLKSETMRRILLEKKSEADESAVASLVEKNNDLTRALESETMRSQQLSLELEKSKQQEVERVASQKTNSAAMAEEKRMWTERASSLEDEVRFLREQLDVAGASTSQVDALSAENASLRYELESKVSECEELYRKSNEVDEYKSQSFKHVEELTNENHSLQKQIDDLQASQNRDSELSTGQTKKLNETIFSLQEILGEKSVRIEQDLTTIKELESRRDALEDLTQSQRQELETLRADYDRLGAQLQERDNAHKQIETELRDSKESTGRIQTECDELADRLESATKHHLEKLNENLSGLKELKDINSLLIQEKSDLEMDVVNMATTQEALDFKSAELDLAKSANAKLETEATENKARLASLESERSSLEEQLRSLQDELSLSLRSRNDAADSTQAEVDTMIGENKRLSERCQELEQTVDRILAEASMNEAEVSALESEMKEVMAQRDELQKQYDALQPQRSVPEDHAASNEALASRIEISSLSDRNQELMSRASNLEEQLRQQTDALERAKMEVTQCTQEKEALVDEKEVLVGKIESMEASLDQMKLVVESQEHENANSKKVFADVNAEKDEAVAQFTLDIESLRNDLSEVTREKDDVVARSSAIERERDNAISKAEMIQSIVKERDDQIAKLRDDIESTRGQYKNKIHDLERQLDGYQSTAKVLEEELKDRAAIIIALEEEKNQGTISSTEDGTNKAAIEAEVAEMRASVALLEADLASSNEDREQLGAENEELFVQLGLLRQMKEEERASLEAQLAERDASPPNDDEMQSTRLQVDELTALCSERAHETEHKELRICEMTIEMESLRRNIELSRDEENTAMALVADLEAKISDLELRSVEKDEKIESLLLKLSSNPHEERRTNDDEEMRKLHNLLDAKEDELAACKSELSTMRRDIEGYRRELSENNEDVINRIAATTCSVSESLAGVASQDVAESAEFMRSKIISLAVAVQSAENGRAEALDRVVNERERNAESLSKLGENLKRFYSTMACTD